MLRNSALLLYQYRSQYSPWRWLFSYWFNPILLNLLLQRYLSFPNKTKLLSIPQILNELFKQGYKTFYFPCFSKNTNTKTNASATIWWSQPTSILIMKKIELPAKPNANSNSAAVRIIFKSIINWATSPQTLNRGPGLKNSPFAQLWATIVISNPKWQIGE